MSNAPSPTRLSAVVAATAAGVAALGVGELVAGLRSTWRSPVVGVAESVIDRVPKSVKDFAIERFGRNDKVVLVVGIVVMSVLFAMLLGLVARRNRTAAALGFVTFALVGIWGSQRPVNATAANAVPSIAAGATAVALLFALLHRAPSTAAGIAEGERQPARARTMARPTSTSRRSFLAVSAAVTAASVAAAAGGRALRSRFSAAASRAAVQLPPAVSPLLPAPASVSPGDGGISSFYTPNDRFYRIDTAVLVPQVLAEDWSLRIHGMVEREVTFGFDDILGRRLVEQDITLSCVSNTVGGDLVGNARWLGVPLLDLLEEAGIDPSADQLVGRSVDGWTSGMPIAALDGQRPALLAIGMNGEPLPLEHGFPARVVVSGLYGYVSATKWVTELEVTRFDEFDAYWVKREWDAQAPIKLMSRIDTPRALQNVQPGAVPIGGVAWAQNTGIAKVEVRIDDAAFVEATLADELSIHTWRLWSYQWADAAPGRHTVTVRATDHDGNVQTDQRADPFPNGASGWMSILVQVADAA